jgi:hypothetical protein
MSIKEIARTVGVSKASVSVWVRDIELTREQHEALRLANPAYNGQRAGQLARSERAALLRRAYQSEGCCLARRGDPFHAAGCMLLWAEGSRRRNQVQFSNSDPEMVGFFVRFLRVYFAVPDERFRLACNMHADHAEHQRAIEDFWLRVAGLPRACLTKSTVNVYSKHSQRKRTNMLPYGTCRVTVSSTRIVQSIYGSIQEYAGFQREEWLW